MQIFFPQNPCEMATVDHILYIWSKTCMVFNFFSAWWASFFAFSQMWVFPAIYGWDQGQKTCSGLCKSFSCFHVWGVNICQVSKALHVFSENWISMPRISLIWWISPCNAYLVELASRRGHHVVFGYHAWLHVLAKCGKEASEYSFYRWMLKIKDREFWI